MKASCSIWISWIRSKTLSSLLLLDFKTRRSYQVCSQGWSRGRFPSKEREWSNRWPPLPSWKSRRWAGAVGQGSSHHLLAGRSRPAVSERRNRRLRLIGHLTAKIVATSQATRSSNPRSSKSWPTSLATSTHQLLSNFVQNTTRAFRQRGCELSRKR